MGRPRVVVVDDEDLVLVLLTFVFVFVFVFVLDGGAFLSEFEDVALVSGNPEDDGGLGSVTSLIVEESRENGELLEEVSSLSSSDPFESTSMS